jgi:predicted CopG family antitoxin
VATKTISIDLEAYERLRAARRAEKESFSQVIKRAEWRTERKSPEEFLASWKALPPMAAEELDALEEAQRRDVPREDPWEGRPAS